MQPTRIPPITHGCQPFAGRIVVYVNEPGQDGSRVSDYAGPFDHLRIGAFVNSGSHVQVLFRDSHIGSGSPHRVIVAVRLLAVRMLDRPVGDRQQPAQRPGRFQPFFESVLAGEHLTFGCCGMLHGTRIEAAAVLPAARPFVGLRRAARVDRIAEPARVLFDAADPVDRQGLPQNLWAEWRTRRSSSDPQCARVLAAVKARRSAPPPLRGADGLDAGSAHARPALV